MDAIGFDVYGTLVDPLAIRSELGELAGARAAEFAATWRAKQLEYSFRRSLMGAWEPFETCTAQALEFAAAAVGAPLPRETRQQLLQQYQRLPAFPDASPGLELLRRRGHALMAFSNGSCGAVRDVLANAGLLDFFDDVVSVAEVGIFKPHPNVYRHLAARVGKPLGQTWLVSSNAWDVVGAKGAGLRAAWIRRVETTPFDPWGGAPDLVARSLGELDRVS